MDKVKVLLLQNVISDYRVPVYNKIAEKFDFTVAYDRQDKTKSACLFKKQKISSRQVGPFHVFGRKLFRLCSAYDVVITLPDMHDLEFCLLPFIKRTYKVLCWNIGIRASYTRPYEVDRKHTLLDKVFYNILSASDGLIFYMYKATEFWKEEGLDLSKVFVAINTTAVEPIKLEANCKRDFLFVGTLYKEKGVDKLLETYACAVKEKPASGVLLHIVGDGVERPALEAYVQQKGLEQRVVFHGAIYDEKELAQLFSASLLCFSPTQAGLSVPKSMGYGVPFVTRRDAITGGEIYHITPGQNGVVYEKDEDLLPIMLDAMTDSGKYVQMGLEAKKYYDEHATIDHMAQGVIDALHFVLES